MKKRKPSRAQYERLILISQINTMSAGLLESIDLKKAFAQMPETESPQLWAEKARDAAANLLTLAEKIAPLAVAAKVEQNAHLMPVKETDNGILDVSPASVQLARHLFSKTKRRASSTPRGNGRPRKDEERELARELKSAGASNKEILQALEVHFERDFTQDQIKRYLKGATEPVSKGSKPN